MASCGRDAPRLCDYKALDSALAHHLEANGSAYSQLGGVTIADGCTDHKYEVARTRRVAHVAKAPLRPQSGDGSCLRTNKLSFHGEHL